LYLFGCVFFGQGGDFVAKPIQIEVWSHVNGTLLRFPVGNKRVRMPSSNSTETKGNSNRYLPSEGPTQYFVTTGLWRQYNSYCVP
jgi:hypothetical protein